MTSYLRREEVIRAIHAQTSPLSWSMCSSVVSYSYADVLTSVVPLYRKLLFSHPGLKIFVYSGDVDAIVPYWGSRQWIASLGMKVSKPWQVWLTPDDKQAGGFVQEYENGQFTFITVRDAGHMVPGTQPKRAFHMINHIVHGDPL
jgi:serine carboxypeptidase-like clade 2